MVKQKRRLHISVGLFLLMLMGLSLAFSTLHSHHDLELHRSADFADTGQCLTADATVCPICAHLVTVDLPGGPQAADILFKVEELISPIAVNVSSRSFSFIKGRGPPLLA